MASIGLEIKVDSADITKKAIERIINEWEFKEDVSEEYKAGFYEFGNAVLGFLDKCVEEEKSKPTETPKTDSKSDTPTKTDFTYFTAEQVRKMSQKEVRENFQNIVKSMKLWK